MNFLKIVLSLLIGSLVSFVSLQTQKLTVMNLNPARPMKSKMTIIGGAILRWILILIVLVGAGSNSLSALLTVFASYMVSRTLILAKWQMTLSTKNRF
jgi:hypothetical protein